MGAVTSSPSGIDCRGDCTQEYEEDKVVTLTAHPLGEEESEFTGWSLSSGSCPGTGTCKVTMSAAKEVKANFVSTAAPKFKLTVEKTGTGTGSSHQLSERNRLWCRLRRRIPGRHSGHAEPDTILGL